jgi:REP element-mobilizing transposase RayT
MPSTHVSLSYHLVFSTKYRQPLIAPEWRDTLYDYFGGCLRTAGGTCLEIGGRSDHVHCLAGLRATHSVADVLRDLKRATSTWVRDVLHLKFAWQEGYAAFTVSPHDCKGLVRYIRDQEEHHRVRTFQEEYVALLQEHGIEFDERYLW